MVLPLVRSTHSFIIHHLFYLLVVWGTVSISKHWTSGLSTVSSFEATLLEQKAKWHKLCYSKVSTMNYSEQKRGKLQLAIVTWNVLLPNVYTRTKDRHERKTKHISKVDALFVRLHQHQIHIVKCQCCKWLLKFVTVLMFC